MYKSEQYVAETKMVEQIKASNIMSLVEKICNFGDRFVGQPGDWEALQYLEQQFNLMGYKTTKTEIEVPTFKEKETKLVVNGTIELNATSAYFSPATSEKGLEGDLVFVGSGKEEEYEGKDVEGKIVVLQEETLGYDRFWLGSFAPIAKKRGALGLIAIHPMPWAYRMSLEAGMGSHENRFSSDPLPSVCISALDGQALMFQLGRGNAKAYLKVDTEIKPCLSYFLSAKKEGEERPEERVSMIAHRDCAMPPGANDNGGGTALLLEIARALKSYSNKRTIEFISSTAEEGSTPGAYLYCEAVQSTLKNMKALFNVDMVGVGGPLRIIEMGQWPDQEEVYHPEWLNGLIDSIAEERGYLFKRLRATWGFPEHGKFMAHGVPSACFWTPDDPYYHSVYDAPENLNANNLKVIGDVISVALSRLANN